jgi:hypothetical protein
LFLFSIILSNQVTEILAVSGRDTGEPNTNPAGGAVLFSAERIGPSHLARDIQGVAIGCHHKYLDLLFRMKVSPAQDKRPTGTDILCLSHSGPMRSQ